MNDEQPTHPNGNHAHSSYSNSLAQDRIFDQTDPSILHIRFQELFDFALPAQIITNLRGIILEANHSAATIFRHSKAFLIGKPLGLLLSEGHRGQFYKILTTLEVRGTAELESRVGPENDSRRIALRAVIAGINSDSQRALWWYVDDLKYSQHPEQVRAALMRRLMDSQEEERRRLSREIHDQLGQDLTALTLGLKSLESDLPESSAARLRLRDLKTLTTRLGRQIHDIAIELRPVALDDLGLKAATEDMMLRWSQRSGVEIGFHLACPDPGRFPPEVESAVYRIIQESLTNVSKHACARSVSVIIEAVDNHLMLLVEDDGQGFDCELHERSSALGLLGMSERVALVGGTLQIESSPGMGTTIRARIPVTSPLETETNEQNTRLAGR